VFRELRFLVSYDPIVDKHPIHLPCSASVPPVDLPAVIGGKYRPREILGVGATGTVYSVEHTFTGELLALKVMRAHLGASPDAIARFKREARAAAKIRSPHFVRIFDADVAAELGGAPYLVMDLLEGIDLEQLSGEQPVEPETVVDWLGQIALPLDKAHRIGIVHRDLKPENLFLTRRDDGSPLIKILDFGIAKIAAESPSTTQSGQIFGTPFYMAPEQARGDPTHIGPATDLYALGLIAYKLLTGAHYRNQTSLSVMLSEIQNAPLRAPSECGHAFGPDFDQWFLRACQPDPAQRFATAAEQIDALAHALGVSVDADADAMLGPSSSVRRQRLLTLDSRSKKPEASPDAIATLRARPAERDAAGAARGATMFASSSVSKTTAGAHARTKRRRLVLLAFSALVCLPLVVLVVSRGRLPPTQAAAAWPSASANEPAVASGVANAPSTLNVPSVRPVTSASVPPTLTTQSFKRTASVLPVQAPMEQVRTPGRTSPARTGAPRSKVLADDDPLSDQQ
jgi:serine/threonine protein kinase